MEDPTDPKQIKLQVKIRDDMASGRCSNLALVHHNDSEFVLDFLFVQPQTPRAEVVNRVVMSPRNFKRTVRLLEERLQHFEKLFGEIAIPSFQPPESSYH